MEKSLEWALQNQCDDFMDVIFTDECTVQLETHHQFVVASKERLLGPNQGNSNYFCYIFDIHVIVLLL